jgi:hypothetical protein
MKKTAVFLSVLLPLLAVAGIAVAVYTAYPLLSRTDIYNLTISLIVILFSAVAVISVLSLKKDPNRR